MYNSVKWKEQGRGKQEVEESKRKEKKREKEKRREEERGEKGGAGRRKGWPWEGGVGARAVQR